MGAKSVVYGCVKDNIHSGDVLLFRRGDGLVSKLITVAGRSPYCHAGMVERNNGEWWCLETLQWKGGQRTRLSELVHRYPGQIVVFSIAPEFRARYNRRRAVAAMQRFVHRPYGWRALARATLTHLPFARVLLFRILLPFIVNDHQNGNLPFCSMAVSRACRAGKLDLVPNLGDSWTEPGDLGRSAALVERFALE